MVALWMGYAALVTALLTVAAWAADRALAGWGAPRRWAWSAALAFGIAVPAVAGWHRWQRAHAPPSVARTGSTDTIRGVAVLSGGRSGASPGDVGGDARPSPAGTAGWDARPGVLLTVGMRRIEAIGAVRTVQRAALRVLSPLDRPLLLTWAVASLVGAAILAHGALAVRTRRRTWRPAVVAGERVWLAPDLGPALVGTVRPRIVLPAPLVDALAWPELRLVLAHERAHRDARDPLLLALALGALVVAPWNVPLWIAARRLRLAVEADCDRRVLRAHPDARRYARLLVDVADRMLAPAVSALVGTPAAALLDPPGLLERRVGWLLGPARPGTPAGSTAIAAGALGVAALACAVPRPAPLASATAVDVTFTARVSTARADALVPAAPHPTADASLRATRTPDALPPAVSPERPRTNTATLVGIGRAVDSAAQAHDAELDRTRAAVLAAAHDHDVELARVQAAAIVAAHERDVELARLQAAAASAADQLGEQMRRLGAGTPRAISVRGVARTSAVTPALVHQVRVELRLQEFDAATRALARDPRARARFDAAAAALRREMDAGPTTSVWTVGSATATSDSTRDATPVMGHDDVEMRIARGIAARVPHTRGRGSIFVLLDSGMRVRRTVVQSRADGQYPRIDAGALRGLFPELGTAALSVGTTPVLAPNDSTYVAWVRPVPPR